MHSNISLAIMPLVECDCVLTDCCAASPLFPPRMHFCHYYKIIHVRNCFVCLSVKDSFRVSYLQLGCTKRLLIDMHAYFSSCMVGFIFLWGICTGIVFWVLSRFCFAAFDDVIKFFLKHLLYAVAYWLWYHFVLSTVSYFTENYYSKNQ